MIFTITDEEVLLLMPFVKRQSRDSMRALEQSIAMLAEIERHPEQVIDYEFYKEDEGP